MPGRTINQPDDKWERAAESVVDGKRESAVPSGSPPPVQRQTDPRHARGHAGEQALAFTVYRFEDGWATIRGPSGAGGHGVTTAGEDGLFYNVRTRELHIVDNKSLARRGRVGSATAIDPTRNLLQNLDGMIRHVEGQRPDDVPMRQRVLRMLRQTRAAVRDGRRIPGRVQLVVGNAGGQSTGVTSRLRRLGVTFVDVNQPIVPRPGTRRPSLGRPPGPVTHPGAGARGRVTSGRGARLRGRGGGTILDIAQFVLDVTIVPKLKESIAALEQEHLERERQRIDRALERQRGFIEYRIEQEQDTIRRLRWLGHAVYVNTTIMLEFEDRSNRPFRSVGERPTAFDWRFHKLSIESVAISDTPAPTDESELTRKEALIFHSSGAGHPLWEQTLTISEQLHAPVSAADRAILAQFVRPRIREVLDQTGRDLEWREFPDVADRLGHALIPLDFDSPGVFGAIREALIAEGLSWFAADTILRRLRGVSFP